MLFQPLPYPSPDRLVIVGERDADGSASNVGFMTFADLARDSRTLERAAAVGDWQVTLDGAEVRLTPTEFDLLKVLVANAGRVLTHGYLLRTVWGPEYEGESQLLRVFIGQLRRKVERDPSRPRHILTDPGVGYRFRIDDECAMKANG